MKKSEKIKLHTLIFDLDNEQYHRGVKGFSSSQLKDLIDDDEDLFIEKHVKKTIEREQVDAFDVGTYFHTGVLEPHKLKVDCVVYPGKIRRGEAWEKFKKKNAGRAIVTESQKMQAEGLVKAVKNSPVCQQYLDGDPEVSLFVKIVVDVCGEIYAPYFGKRLTRNGWVKDLTKPSARAFEMIIKVRADMLGKTYISDLKSTTGNAKSEEQCQAKVKFYNYDLSAALYLDMFSLLLSDLEEFWWLFASKERFNARAQRASKNSILVGRAKYIYAMRRLADLAAANFGSVDFPGEIEPTPADLRWLIEKDSDLL